MPRVPLRRLLSVCLAAGLVACVPAPAPDPAAGPEPTSAQDDVNPATVTDLPAFAAFIATRPTPEAFASRYPGVALILPGMVSTRELRMDHSRYFAELDAEGRITGGRFQ